MSVLVLDFDGTMTDAEREGEPVPRRLPRRSVRRSSAAPTPRPAEVDAIAAEVDAAMLAQRRPTHPFLWMGRAVAPATVDPYLRMVPIAQRDPRRVARVSRARVDRGRAARQRPVQVQLRQDARPPGVPRRAPASCSRGLAGTADVDRHQLRHRTRSPARSPRSTARRRASRGSTSRVRGYARKFEVDDAWQDAPARARRPGPRSPGAAAPPRVPRHRCAACSTRRTRRSTDLVVVGDIFELDLAMPLALGARVGLVATRARPRTSERSSRRTPRGRVLDALGEVAAFAFQP